MVVCEVEVTSLNSDESKKKVISMETRLLFLERDSKERDSTGR